MACYDNKWAYSDRLLDMLVVHVKFMIVIYEATKKVIWHLFVWEDIIISCVIFDPTAIRVFISAISFNKKLPVSLENYMSTMYLFDYEI